MHSLALFLEHAPPDKAAFAQMFALFGGLFLLVSLAILISVVVSFWFICDKAGFSGWLSLLCLIPCVGMLILIYLLAFSRWDVVPAPGPQYIPPPQG
jgi:hypothetical protein